MSTTVLELDDAPVRPAHMGPRSGRLRNVGIALGTLAYVVAIAFAILTLGGVVLHALQPAKQFDIFSAFHEELVVGILLGLAIFWLVPPYPWVARTPGERATQGPAQSAGETGARGTMAASADTEAGIRLAGRSGEERSMADR